MPISLKSIKTSKKMEKCKNKSLKSIKTSNKMEKRKHKMEKHIKWEKKTKILIKKRGREENKSGIQK
jgi:hypothetical protein